MRHCAAAVRPSALWAVSVSLAAWSAAALTSSARQSALAGLAREKKPHAQHEALYVVDLSFDIQEMRGSDGLTMVFDKKEKMLRLDLNIAPAHGLAWGRFDDRIAETGWSELYIETTGDQLVSNDLRVYSAGYIEGILTAVRMSEFNANTRHLLIRKDASAHALGVVMKLLEEQLHLVKSKAGVDTNDMAEEPRDAYLKHIRYIFFQLWGICDGYNKIARFFQVQDLTLVDLLLLNAAGELPQFMEAYTPEAIASRAASKPGERPFFMQLRAQHALHNASKADTKPGAVAVNDGLDDKHWERRVVDGGRCSGLVRLAVGNQDLFMGHTTWDDYSKMTRIFKYYKIHLDDAETIASHIAFSSYPGVVSSTDDFYTMDSGLGVMETSLIVLDPLRWDSVMDKPHIPNFMHIMAVNRLAAGASHWVQLFTDVNTGTYTSQWLIVDYNQFEATQPLQDNTFWVAEVVPGVTHAEDMSHFLRTHGYFPSFNRPFFDSA